MARKENNKEQESEEKDVNGSSDMKSGNKKAYSDKGKKKIFKRKNKSDGDMPASVESRTNVTDKIAEEEKELEEVAPKKSTSKVSLRKIRRERERQNTQVNDADRIVRKIYVDAKKNSVIKVTIVSVFAVFVVACVVFFGLLNVLPTGIKTTTEDHTSLVPCPVGDAQIVEAGSIHIRVLNGTGLSGYATAVSSALQQRSFVTMGIDDAPSVTNDTAIYFGKNAINEAYTLAMTFDNPVLVMDDRSDYLIDVVIGKNFSKLTDSDSVKTSGTLTGYSGCIDASSISNLPKAFSHTEYYPSVTDESSDSSGSSSSGSASSSGSSGTGTQSTN